MVYHQSGSILSIFYLDKKYNGRKKDLGSFNSDYLPLYEKK
jgi:hypothetical protein